VFIFFFFFVGGYFLSSLSLPALHLSAPGLSLPPSSPSVTGRKQFFTSNMPSCFERRRGMGLINSIPYHEENLGQKEIRVERDSSDKSEKDGKFFTTFSLSLI